MTKGRDLAGFCMKVRPQCKVQIFESNKRTVQAANHHFLVKYIASVIVQRQTALHYGYKISASQIRLFFHTANANKPPVRRLPSFCFIWRINPLGCDMDISQVRRLRDVTMLQTFLKRWGKSASRTTPCYRPVCSSIFTGELRARNILTIDTSHKTFSSSCAILDLD